MQLWDDESDPNERLLLLTPDEIEALPDGTMVYSIFHYRDKTSVLTPDGPTVLPKEDIDGDTRFGHTAWGLRIEMFEAAADAKGKKDVDKAFDGAMNASLDDLEAGRVTPGGKR